MGFIGDYFKNIGVGTDTDRTKIEADGTINREGAARTWDDIVGSLIGKALSSVLGKVDYDWAENAIKFQSGGNIETLNDLIIFSKQYPHRAVTNGTMNLHIHWEQTDTYTNVPIQFTVRYRIQKNLAAKTTAWNKVVIEADDINSKGVYVGGTLNQITELIHVDMTDAGISPTVQFQMARTDAATGDILATFIDAHVESDTDGSREEYSK